MGYRVFSFLFVIAFAFSSNLYANRGARHTGAGVLPFFLENPTEPNPRKRIIKIALGEEPRSNGKVVGDFGGKRDKGESFSKAGYREFQEETGHYSFPHVSLNQVANSPYLTHYHQPTDQYYEIYLVQVVGKMPTVQEMIANGRKATEKLGHNAHVEKTDYIYVDVDQFLHSILNNQNCPGINLPYFRSFKATITKNLPAFQRFVDSIRNQPVSRSLPPKAPASIKPVVQPVVRKVVTPAVKPILVAKKPALAPKKPALKKPVPALKKPAPALKKPAPAVKKPAPALKKKVISGAKTVLRRSSASKSRRRS